MKKFREMNLLKIAGIAAAVFLIASYLALNFSKLPLISSERSYSAYVSSAVGLEQGEVVTIAGVRVGKLTGLVLDKGRARVDFSVGSTYRLHDRAQVNVKVLNPVGVEYLELVDDGTAWLQGPIPVDRTTVPGTLVSDLNQLTNQTQQTDIPQLVQALEALTKAVGANTPAETKAALDGVAQLSAVVAGRRDELSNLVTQANQLTSLLNGHSGSLINLIDSSNLLLGELNDRKSAIDNLLKTTTTLTDQLNHIIVGDRSVLDPMLANLQALTNILATDSNNFAKAIPLLAAFSRYTANATGSGPYADFVAPTLVIPDSLIAQCAAIGKIDPERGCRP